MRLAQVTAMKCWETQGLAFGFDVVESGNGTVPRGHKNMQGPFGSNAEDALAEGDYGWRTGLISVQTEKPSFHFPVT